MLRFRRYFHISAHCGMLRLLQYSDDGQMSSRPARRECTRAAGVGDAQLFAARAEAGAFDAAPDAPYEFLQGYGAFRLGLDLPSPAPYLKPRRFAPLTGAGGSAFPRTPLAAGGKERVTWLPPTFKLTAPAVASASICDLAAYCSPFGRSNPENTSGIFVPLSSRGAACQCRFTASACGTKSLPCGLRARGRPARHERVCAETV